MKADKTYSPSLIADKLYYRTRLLCNQAVRRLQNSKKLIVIGSAHKVGSTWVFNLLKDLCALQPLPLPKSVLQAHPKEQAADIDMVDILGNLQVMNGWYIFKSHSYPPLLEFPADHAKHVNFLTVIRDPRDVIVSASFYLANLPQEKGGWGREFAELNETERIMNVIKGGDFIISRLQKWYGFPSAYKIKYEDLLRDGVRELNNILDFLKIELGEKRIDAYYKKYSFKQQTGRNPGTEDKNAFLRKGISGDWKNYFTGECINTFKVAQEGQWNKLLVLLGYEKHLDW
jgi:hypothetical protein